MTFGQTRRTFCKTVAAGSALLFTGGFFMTSTAAKATTQDNPMITLPPLPYAQNALEPHITANTLSFHYGKHHQAYVTNLNNLIKDTPLAGKSLDEIIMASAKDAGKAGIFNNAAQVWN